MPPFLRRPTGAALGAVAATLLFLLVVVTVTGFGASTGFGALGDAFLAVVLFVLTAGVLTLAIWGLVGLVRRVPPPLLLVAPAVLAAVLRVTGQTSLWLELLGLVLTALLVFWAGWAVGRLAEEWIRRRRDPETARVRRRTVANSVAAGFVLAILVPASLWALHSSHASHTGPLHLDRNPGALAGLPNPGATGNHEVVEVTYGSGPDRRGDVFGAHADLATPTLDLRPLLPNFRGLEARLHAAHWGFGLDAIPLNARMHLPANPTEPMPVAVLIHGVESAEDHSERGFDYLARVLASRGVAAVSVDMNFLDHPHIANHAGEMPVRAWLALEHLRFLQEWQDSGSDPRADLLDLERIVLVGHSRGGEAAALAAALNRTERYPPNAAIPLSFGFGVRGVVALAPTDQFWKPGEEAIRLEEVSYLVLHGSHDGDLASFMGSAQWQRTRIPEGGPHMKGSIWVSGANHANFSTTGASRDRRGLAGLLLNSEALLTPRQQQDLTLAYVSAFLETVGRGDPTYRPLFSDPRAGLPWLPPTDRVTRFEDGSTRVLASFEGGMDPAHGSEDGVRLSGEHLLVWREEQLLLRNDRQPLQETRAVRLAWDRDRTGPAEPWWEVTLPEVDDASPAPPDARLRFAVGHQVLSAGLPDFHVELRDRSGTRARVPAATWAPRPPGEFPQLWRWRFLDRLLTGQAEEVLQDYEIPMGAFLAEAPDLDLEELEAIRFVFDGRGTLLLDDIGFRTPVPRAGREATRATGLY